MKHKSTVRKDEHAETTFAATTLAVDRYGEVVVPEGVSKTLDNYKGNPVLHYGHQTSPWWDGQKESLPIGRANNIRFSEKRNKEFGAEELLFDAEFSTSNEFAKTVEGLVRERMLNAVSIGFMPKVIGTEPIMEGQSGVTHLEWELLENSIVPIPANQEALRRAIAKSQTLTRFKDMLLPDVPVLKFADGVYRGETAEAPDGHKHTFLIEVVEGKITMGATSYEQDHFHVIANAGTTESEDDHIHSFNMELRSTSVTDCKIVVAKGLGLPEEVLEWTKEDIEAIKRFLALRASLQETPKDSDLEELSSILTSVRTSLEFDPGEVIREGVSQAITNHIRGTN